MLNKMEDSSSAGERLQFFCSRLTWTVTKFNVRLASFLKCVPFQFVPQGQDRKNSGILQTFPKSSWKRTAWAAITVLLCAYAVLDVQVFAILAKEGMLAKLAVNMGLLCVHGLNFVFYLTIFWMDPEDFVLIFNNLHYFLREIDRKLFRGESGAVETDDEVKVEKIIFF